MLNKMQTRSGDRLAKKQLILILILFSALFGLAVCVSSGAGAGSVPDSLPFLAECIRGEADAGSFQTPVPVSSDEAFLPGDCLRVLRVARSGGTVRPIPPRFPASACEVVNFSVCSVPEGRGVVPVPDFPPQILFWLASALEVRAGPCAVRIG